MDQKTVIRWSFFNLIFPVKIAVLKSLFIIFTKRANPKSDPLKIEMKKMRLIKAALILIFYD